MRPLVAHIDLAAITHNYALARQCAPGRQALAVVKADAYGHGLEPVVAALAQDYLRIAGFGLLPVLCALTLKEIL